MTTPPPPLASGAGRRPHPGDPPPPSAFHCSAVCRYSRRLLTDPAFLRRYRAFHGVPPMLGFIFNLYGPHHARFVCTTSFRPRTLDHGDMHVRDSRHGRVLLFKFNSKYVIGIPELVVWNPITAEQWGPWGLPMPLVRFPFWNVAVLCAVGGGCDHLACHGGPFLVVFVGTNSYGLTSAFVYSSEAASWSDATHAEHPDNLASMDRNPSRLVGNTIYFTAALTKTIVAYDLGRRQLEFIEPPFGHRGYSGALIQAVGGGLGFVSVKSSSLYLWSREVGPDGTAAWTQSRVIELTLPTRHCLCQPAAVGFAEGLGDIFLKTDAGVFTINLKSDRVKQVSSSETNSTVIPYMSFYTPGDCTVLNKTTFTKPEPETLRLLNKAISLLNSVEQDNFPTKPEPEILLNKTVSVLDLNLKLH
ncbi:uncharacterized protein LOC133904040 [Phragmites australis]|uniref:uncharacterized protein LOC133904040 n=1 Tax=Phragmites australis TaxID=29695 RepID=UPI002D76721D|nr:uncharacterized protein LOC133904040 [Phragmites australis]